MSNFEVALSAWLSVLSSHGCEISHFMNPGASEKRIAAIETAIGYKFTEDLKELYRWADGQRDYIRDANRRIVHYADGGADAVYDIDPTPGKYLCPLFGNYSFDSLIASLDSYLGWIDIVDELDDSEHNRESVTVRKGHTVHRQYFRKGWFPISNNSGGDSYAVDFDPPEGGTYGQVIIIGPNEDERRVLASSITELLTLASSCRTLELELYGNRAQPIPVITSFEMECW
jgi:cell wall assembly regulator SMI1